MTLAKQFGTIRSRGGEVIAGASVLVYDGGTRTLASLVDKNGAAVANPVLSRANGYWEFYAASGQYDLVMNEDAVNGVFIGLPAVDPGRRAVNTLLIAADVVGGTKVTIGADVLEIEILTTDSTDITADDSFNQDTGPITVLAADYPHLLTTLGTLILVESEVMRLTATGDSLTYSRAQSGTTIATHADATAIYIGDGIAAGSTIAVGMGGTLTPTDFTPALIADFNELGVEPITMAEISVNEILLVADNAGAVVTATTETLAGSGNAFLAAAMYGGADPALRKVSTQQRVPLATEVTLGTMRLAYGFTPTIVEVRVCPSATPGLDKLWDGAIVIAGGIVTIDNSGTTDWAATDTVTVTAIG